MNAATLPRAVLSAPRHDEGPSRQVEVADTCPAKGLRLPPGSRGESETLRSDPPAGSRERECSQATGGLGHPSRTAPEGRGEGARRAPLENYAGNAARAGQGHDARTDRWADRGALWDLSALPRVRKCGRVVMTPAGVVQVRSDGQRVGYAGLCTCGSPWACPVCAAKIWSERRVELGVLLCQAFAEGHGAAFGALTVRHHAGTPLRAVWDGLLACYRALGKDLTVQRVRKALGVVGLVRLVEVTCGCNGWHPHVHLLVIFDHMPTGDEVAALHAAHVAAWLRAAVRLGLDAPSTDAQHLHAVNGHDVAGDLSAYMGKSGRLSTSDAVAFEMTGQGRKSARSSKGQTPADLLRSVRRDGDADALDAWHEYETVSKGRRALTWSRGLRDRYGVGAERSDEDIAAEEVGSRRDVVLEVLDWSPVVASRGVLGGQLLSAVQAGGAAAGLAFCAEHGIPAREA